MDFNAIHVFIGYLNKMFKWLFYWQLFKYDTWNV